MKAISELLIFNFSLLVCATKLEEVVALVEEAVGHLTLDAGRWPSEGEG